MKRKHVVVFTCGRYMRWYRNSTSFHSSYEAVSWSNTRLMTTSLSGGGARGNTTSSASCHGDRSGRTSSYNRGRGGQLILFTFWRLTGVLFGWNVTGLKSGLRSNNSLRDKNTENGPRLSFSHSKLLLNPDRQPGPGGSTRWREIFTVNRSPNNHSVTAFNRKSNHLSEDVTGKGGWSSSGSHTVDARRCHRTGGWTPAGWW